MAERDLCLIRSQGPSGELVVRLGDPVLDGYLELLSGRCRPNTVLAAASDLRVFFCVVGKPPEQVTAADVLGFVTAQRIGRGIARVVATAPGEGEPAGVSSATVAHRLSMVSGLFGYLQAAGVVAANPVPRGLPSRRERLRPGQGVPLTRRARRLPRILSPAEVDALTQALSTHRDRAMVAAGHTRSHRCPPGTSWSRRSRRSPRRCAPTWSSLAGSCDPGRWSTPTARCEGPRIMNGLTATTGIMPR